MADQSNSSPVVTSYPDADERIYLLRRADEHRQMAEKAEEAGARAIHLRFEQLYRQRVEEADLVHSDQGLTQQY